ncbi:MAG TPA: hypothetical protein VNX66_04340 [Candidatus Sulfotelmatobacter sp.]|jgi:hypothetical protein|nr:hypothetical protein [Candidatus Sulfotelmatobacter sp.]
MSSSEFDQLAAEIGRDIVARAAPQELPLYRSVSAAYLQSPSDVSGESIHKEEILGFGVAEAVTYITPVALPVLSSVLTFLAGELKSSIHDQHLIGDTLKKLFSKNKPSVPQISSEVLLTRDQLERVRKLAFEKARELNLKSKEASLLADSIVGSLATTA